MTSYPDPNIKTQYKEIINRKYFKHLSAWINVNKVSIRDKGIQQRVG